MPEQNRESKICTGAFVSEEPKNLNRYSGKKTQNRKADGGNGTRDFRVPFAEMLKNNRLLRNTAVCAVCALAVAGIISAGTGENKEAVENIRAVLSYEYDEEEEYGKLEFVNAATEDEILIAEAQKDFVYPVDGIVTTTFAQNGSGAIITATDTRDVVSSKAGEIYEVAENYVRVLNNDGTMTTYFGVASELRIGDNVQAGNLIGELTSDTLYVEQAKEGKKVDPFG